VTTEYIHEGGKLYELISFYAVPDASWSIELTQMSSDGGGLAHVLVSDEDIDRACEVVLDEGLTATPSRSFGASLRR
jgi:hypothetical protein